MFKPLFKYKGGKYDEYKKIKNFLPTTINNYYEPFFGSGGVFFQLQNENKIKGNSFVNDYSKSLMGNSCSNNGLTKWVLLMKDSAWLD